MHYDEMDATLSGYVFQNPEIEALMQDMEQFLLDKVGDREIRDMEASMLGNRLFFATFVALDMATKPLDKAQMDLPLHN